MIYPWKKAPSASVQEIPPRQSSTDRIEELSIVNGRQYTAYAWSTAKKWWVLTVVFWIQMSMNWNAAIYSNSVSGLSKEFGISAATARQGGAVFLILYALGCELWAPFSEEFGRKGVMIISLGLVTVWQIPCALATNWSTLFAARALGGLSSAGGSVTLGIVADLYPGSKHQWALLYVVLASVLASVFAPILGGFIEAYLHWRWVFWISLMFNFGTLAAFAVFVPETRPEVMLDNQARQFRKQGRNIWGPREVKGTFRERISLKHIATLMWRPYYMLLKEPIVMALSLLSGFSDTLIYIGLNSFGMVTDEWNFSTVAKGLQFVPLAVSYFIGAACFIPAYRHDRRTMQGNRHAISPERRLVVLLYLVPLMPIGLLCYALASMGPGAHVHWSGPLLSTVPIGIANFAIYMATIDYMVAAYGPFAASATGGNGFCRDLLAGCAAFFATPLYDAFGGSARVHATGPYAADKNLGYVWPTLILCGIGLLLAVPVYVFYFKGAWFREKSTFAREIAAQMEKEEEQQEAELGGVMGEAVEMS